MSYYIRKNGVTKRLAAIPQGYPAELISYDNTSSGLTADEVQGAIDEVNSAKVSKSGDTMSGALIVGNSNATQLELRRNHSGVTLASSIAYIGNSIPEGTEGCSDGVLRIYGNGQYYTGIEAPNSTENRKLTAPDKSGTIALTDDIPPSNLIYIKSARTSSIGSVIVTHPETFSSARGQMYAYGNGNGTPWFISIVYGYTYARCIVLCNLNDKVGINFIDSTHFAITSGTWDTVNVCFENNNFSVTTADSNKGIDLDNTIFPCSKSDKGSISVTGNGSKTLGTLLNELFALADASKITTNSYILTADRNKWVYTYKNASGNEFHYNYSIVTSSGLSVTEIMLKSNASTCNNIKNTTYTDLSSEVESNEYKIELFY